MLVDVAWAIGAAVAALLYWKRRSDHGSEQKIYDSFCIPRSRYRIIGGDIGGIRPRITLRDNTLQGQVDVLFHSRDGMAFHVGELKSRRFKGEMRPREYYQTILYMGLLMDLHPGAKVTGSVRYSNQNVPVRFDKALYKKLRAIAPEVLNAKRTWVPQNPLPLAKRH